MQQKCAIRSLRNIASQNQKFQVTLFKPRLAYYGKRNELIYDRRQVDRNDANCQTNYNAFDRLKYSCYPT